TLKWNAVPTLFDIPNPPPKPTPKRKHTIRAAPEVHSKKTKSNISQASQVMADQTQSSNPNQSAFFGNSEPISIDSDSDNSSDNGSVHEVIGDEDSNSNSNSNTNSNTLSQRTRSSNAEKNIEDLTRLELKKLSLDAHGTFMADFDPEKSKREIRKMNRRLYAKGSKRMRLYNEKGQLLESLVDICDCLNTKCPGCHFPCPKCGSAKCGTECRCNRKYTINYIEVEGTNKTFSFSPEKKS
ncbi:hypothetical protein EGW08_020450, partial [Elysia chlorotica]